MKNKIIQTLGVASSNGGPSISCGQGPLILQKSEYALPFAVNESQLSLNWQEPLVVSSSEKNSLKILNKQSCYISQFVQQQIEDKQQFLVLGGDHSSAVGTWAGVLNGLPTDSTFALIWIDAHMDANTLATSPSGNLHGMPVSLILGAAEHELQSCSPAKRSLAGSDLYMLGVRSYETDELILLSKHKVNVFEMARIEQQSGICKVLKELIDTVSRCYDYFAISLDLDAIDPQDAPGVETPVPDGIASAELLTALQKINFGENFLGLEIAEFDPAKDVEHKTEKLVFDIVSTVYA